jgi:hypothetical protein
MKDWKKIINSFITVYNPIIDIEISQIILETYYLILGMQNHSQMTKLLTRI